MSKTDQETPLSTHEKKVLLQQELKLHMEKAVLIANELRGLGSPGIYQTANALIAAVQTHDMKLASTLRRKLLSGPTSQKVPGGSRFGTTPPPFFAPDPELKAAFEGEENPPVVNDEESQGEENSLDLDPELLKMLTTLGPDQIAEIEGGMKRLKHIASLLEMDTKGLKSKMDFATALKNHVESLVSE